MPNFIFLGYIWFSVQMFNWVLWLKSTFQVENQRFPRIILWLTNDQSFIHKEHKLPVGIKLLTGDGQGLIHQYILQVRSEWLLNSAIKQEEVVDAVMILCSALRLSSQLLHYCEIEESIFILAGLFGGGERVGLLEPDISLLQVKTTIWSLSLL